MSPEGDNVRMRQLVAEMSVISEARGQQFGDIIQGGSDPSRAPRGPTSSMAQYFARAWRRAHTQEQRVETLMEAETALIRARYAPRRTDTPGTLEWRLMITSDPRPALVVAEIYGVSLSHVYNLRKMSGKTRQRSRHAA